MAESTGARHLAKIFKNSGCNVLSGKVIFWKFHPEILDYLLRYSSFSVWNERFENHLTILPFFSLSVFC